MAERSFEREVQKLRLGKGEVFEGEGILAVTKALLQSGISYVGGYEGAPISHMVDVLSDARSILDDLGVHVENCANEAGAVAMLGASINYPVRGAVAFKSVVGTNVGSDALSNLASPGVMGGAVMILGEDYGEGASIIQERSHAYAMKSQVWLMDPRPSLPKIVETVEQAFELSEASNTPVMVELRIRACHVTGKFTTKDNRKPDFSANNQISEPVFDPDKVTLPPATYVQEKRKVEQRMPAAIEFIRTHRLNEVFAGKHKKFGIICQGGMHSGLIRALQVMGLADAYGKSDIPIYCLNVTYPLIRDEVLDFCKSKQAVLMVEEGQPAYLEKDVKAMLYDAGLKTTVVGKDVLPMAGEYNGGVMLEGVTRFVEGAMAGAVDLKTAARPFAEADKARKRAAEILGTDLPARPPGFCTGCPERPVFSALKLVQEDVGKLHVSGDIGCHSFATLAPFNIGNTILGYGLGLASSTGLAPSMKRRVVSIMGDGGFWHNGLSTGVANHLFNHDDGILIILKNGYAAATGHQRIPSSGKNFKDQPTDMDIASALRGVGAKWIRTVDPYKVSNTVKTLKHALSEKAKGLKVIIADGECQLARQRKIKPVIARDLKAGKRVVRTRFGVDEDTCTGDHSCIRLSGCPSLTIKPNPDPLRRDPVASVIDSCVGCGLCGEVAHAAVLCPSFYRAEVVQNPTAFDRFMFSLRRRIITRFHARERASDMAA